MYDSGCMFTGGDQKNLKNLVSEDYEEPRANPKHTPPHPPPSMFDNVFICIFILYSHSQIILIRILHMFFGRGNP